MHRLSISTYVFLCTLLLTVLCGLIVYSILDSQRLFAFSLLRSYFPAAHAIRERILFSGLPKTATEKISIEDQADVLVARKKLTSIIWGSDRYPDTKQPTRVEKNILDDRLKTSVNLKSLDKLSIDMGEGLISTAYYFHAARSNDQLILHHLGHQPEITAESTTTDFFLDHGFDVILFTMPPYRGNAEPEIALDGNPELNIHETKYFDQLVYPLRYFVEPVTIGINYALRQKKYSQIAMLGLSGGGWTTTIAAALDTRISKSYPIAGSLPISIRVDRTISETEAGDFEQRWPVLYDSINYLELYVLGSVGKDRKQIQILNRYDNCCFGGTRYTRYEKYVAAIAAKLNGSFSVFLDTSHHEHKISDAARALILRDLEKKP